jgi:hypothetical protein
MAQYSLTIDNYKRDAVGGLTLGIDAKQRKSENSELCDGGNRKIFEKEIARA